MDPTLTDSQRSYLNVRIEIMEELFGTHVLTAPKGYLSEFKKLNPIVFPDDCETDEQKAKYIASQYKTVLTMIDAIINLSLTADMPLTQEQLDSAVNSALPKPNTVATKTEIAPATRVDNLNTAFGALNDPTEAQKKNEVYTRSSSF